MATTYLECRFCGTTKSLAVLKRDHGPLAPICRALRDEQRRRDLDLRHAGHWAKLLDAAGLTTIGIYHIWEWEEIPEDEREYKLNEETGELRQVGSSYRRHDWISFELVAPVWAYQLAKRLTQDRKLARALGYTQKKRKVTERVEKVVGRKGSREATEVSKEVVWESCDRDKALPFEVRAKILRVAGNNELAREMIYDDPHAAGIIIRDSL